MPEFNLKIAGHTARVTSLFESTPQYFRAYLTEESAEFSVSITPEDLAFEQSDLLEEALREGFKPRAFTDPFLERASIQRRFAEFLLDHDTLLLHGSAVALDGQGYLFTADSGTGKSTHTRLWREAFGDRAVMVNDDKPFVALTRDGVVLHGSPWSGKHGLDTNIAVPLKGICLLTRGAENRIASATPEALLPMLEKQTYAPLTAEKAAISHDLLQTLSQRIPLWHMACNKNPDAARIAATAMRE